MQPDRRKRIETDQRGDVTIARFTDRKLVDEHTIQVVGEQLYQLVDEQHPGALILNFQNVEYMSSRMLGKLLTLKGMLRDTGGRLVLCCLGPTISESFHITGLDQLITVCSDEQHALASP